MTEITSPQQVLSLLSPPSLSLCCCGAVCARVNISLDQPVTSASPADWMLLGEVWERRDNLAYTQPMRFFGVGGVARLAFLSTSWGTSVRFYGPSDAYVEVVDLGSERGACDVYNGTVSKDVTVSGLPNPRFGAPLDRKFESGNFQEFTGRLPRLGASASASDIIAGIDASVSLATFLFEKTGIKI